MFRLLVPIVVVVFLLPLFAQPATAFEAVDAEEDVDQGDPYYGVPLGAMHYSAEGTAAEVYAADEFSIIFNHFHHIPREPGCTAMMVGPPRADDHENVVPGHGVILPLAHPPASALLRHRRHKRRTRRGAAAAVAGDAIGQQQQQQFRGYWPVEFDHLLIGPNAGDAQQMHGTKEKSVIVNTNDHNGKVANKQRQHQHTGAAAGNANNANNKGTMGAMGSSNGIHLVSEMEQRQENQQQQQKQRHLNNNDGSSSSTSNAKLAASSSMHLRIPMAVTFSPLSSTNSNIARNESTNQQQAALNQTKPTTAVGSPSSLIGANTQISPAAGVSTTTTPTTIVPTNSGFPVPSATSTAQMPMPTINSASSSPSSSSATAATVSVSSSPGSSPPTQPLILLGGKRTAAVGQQQQQTMPKAIVGNSNSMMDTEVGGVSLVVRMDSHEIRRSPARQNFNSDWAAGSKGWGEEQQQQQQALVALNNNNNVVVAPTTTLAPAAGLAARTTTTQSRGIGAAAGTQHPSFWVIKDPREGRRQRLIELRKKLDPNYEPPTVSTTAAPFSLLEAQFELPTVRDKLVTFALTNGAKITQYKWIGIWNQCTRKHIPLISLRDVDPPREEKIMPLSGWSHNITSYRLHILNCNTILIPSFHYDARNTTRNTFFFLGVGQFPEAVEHQVKANVVGQRPGEPMRSYTGEDVLLRLPRPYRTFDIDFISIFNTDEQKSFGHVIIPSLLVPPCPDDDDDA